MKRINTSINCFSRAFSLNPKENKIWIEYGSFLYQMNSYFGRQLTMDNLIGHFEEKSSNIIRDILKTKKTRYLNDSLEAYTNALKSIIDEINTNPNEAATETPSTITTPTSGESNDKQNLITKNKKGNDDQWLTYYMFGKIKEKLKSNIFECLDYYLKVNIFSFFF